MEKEEVEDLLLYISDKKSDLEAANKAFAVLYKRFGEFIFNVVKKTIFFNTEKDNSDFANTVCNNTFLEVYDKPLNFSYNPKKHKSQDNAFKVYLAVISKNEKNDLLRESLDYSDRQLKIIDGDDDLFEPSITDEEYDKIIEKLSINHSLLEEALATLSERDRYILLTYYDNFEKGKNTPSKVLNDVEKFYGTTRDNIRMIRNRVKKKLIKYIESRSNLKAI